MDSSPAKRYQILFTIADIQMFIIVSQFLQFYSISNSQKKTFSEQVKASGNWLLSSEAEEGYVLSE